MRYPRHPRRSAILACLLSCAATFAGPGCRTLQLAQAPPPASSVKSVRPTDISADGFKLAFDVEVRNRARDVAIPVNDVRYDFYLGGRKIISDTARLDARIGPGQAETLSFAVPVKWQDVSEAVKALASDGSPGKVKYRLDGRMEVPELDLVSSVPVGHSARLELREVLRQAVSVPDVLPNGSFRDAVSQLEALAPDQVPPELKDAMKLAEQAIPDVPDF